MTVPGRFDSSPALDLLVTYLPIPGYVTGTFPTAGGMAWLTFPGGPCPHREPCALTCAWPTLHTVFVVPGADRHGVQVGRDGVDVPDRY